ncbi:unnamed protein product, partial [Allacma fusca]
MVTDQQPVPRENSLDLDVKYSSDLYKSIRPFLLFGRAIGVLPLGGLNKDNHEALNFRCWSIKSVISILIMLSLLLCLGLSIFCLLTSGSKSVQEFVEAANPVLYYFVGLFGYVYMFRRNDQLRSVLETWKESKVSYNNEDRTLKRDVWLIFGLLFTSAVFENLLQQSIQFTLLDWILDPTMDNFDPLRSYFYNHHYRWSTQFPYHVALSCLFFIWNKLSLYAWNFVDIFVIIVSRALYFQFRAIEKHARENILKVRVDKNHQIEDESELYRKWDTLTTDFETLLSLLNSTRAFLSPLIFTSYAVNLFFVIVHLHMGLDGTTPDRDSTAVEVYETWSFLHLLCRVYVMTLFASRIHDSGNEFLQLFRKCPLDSYSLKVERVERSTISTT